MGKRTVESEQNARRDEERHVNRDENSHGLHRKQAIGVEGVEDGCAESDG